MRPASRRALLRVAGLLPPLVVITAQSASAYIDPGTGSYVLQVVVASVLAAAFVIKSTWHSLKRAVTRLFGRGEGKAERPTNRLAGLSAI